MDLYLLLKFVHVLPRSWPSAPTSPTASGCRAPRGSRLSCDTRTPGIHFLDSRIANPAYALLLVTLVVVAIVFLMVVKPAV